MFYEAFASLYSFCGAHIPWYAALLDHRKPCKITPKSNFFSASPAVGSTVRLLPRYTRSAVLTYRGMLRSSTIASLAKSLLKAILHFLRYEAFASFVFWLMANTVHIGL